MVGTVGRTDLLGPEPREDTRPPALPRAPRTRSSRSPTTSPSTRPTARGRSARHPARPSAPPPSAVSAPRTHCCKRPTRTPSSRSCSPASARSPATSRACPRSTVAVPASTVSSPQLAQLSVDRRRSRPSSGEHSIVDVRPIADFAAGHVPGSLSIELRPVFASWLGWLVEPERQLVFVARRRPGSRRTGPPVPHVGYEQLAGELDGGFDAWRGAGIRTSRPST